MGSSNSRPERPRIRVLLPNNPNPAAAAAPKQRISLKAATLRATLRKLGHPFRYMSGGSRRRTIPQRPRRPPRPPSETALFFENTMLNHRHVPTRLRDQTGTNKPLPRLPSPADRDEHRQQALRALQSQPESPQIPSRRSRSGAQSRVPSIILRKVERSMRSAGPARGSQRRNRVNGRPGAGWI